MRSSSVGQLAVLLRRYMCEGSDGVLLRGDVVEKLFPAFADLSVSTAGGDFSSYKTWVEKLATREYVDELVVLATAQELGVPIVCVTHTPEASTAPWRVSTYAPLVSLGNPLSRVLLGNNDVHVMYLHIGP